MKYCLVAVAALAVMVLSCPAARGECDLQPFLNRSYRPACVKSLLESGLPGDITVKNGEFQTSKDLGGSYFKVPGVVCADLDRDGKKEFLLETWCGYNGANYLLLEYFIFKDPEGAPVASLDNDRAQEDYKRLYPRSLPWTLHEVVPENGGLRAMLYADGAHCCPEKQVFLRYELQGGKLEIRGAPEINKVEQ